MSFPRYPKYKDSGVEWVGEVPEHWLTKPLYSSAGERNESNKGMIEKNLLSLSYGRIVRKDISSNDGLLPESFETYQVVRPGDIVFRPTDLQNDWRSLRSAIVEETGIITSAYIAVIPNGPNPKYLSHLFRAYDAMKVFYSMGGGLRQSMKYSDLKRLPIIVPPVAEQRALAEFLDRETAKIDALVAEQQRLMELLNEKRQAVISHAVTKGLNPNAPMKPSGIEWLGDVPAHWNVSPLKHVCRIESGHTPQKTNEAYWLPEDCCLPWISLNDTKILAASDFIDDTTVKISAKGMANSSAHFIESGAVVMNRDGARVGLSAITTKPMCVSQHIIAWVCGPLVFNHYLLHVLYAMNDEIYRLAGGSTIPTIGMPEVRQMTMPLPPVEEQTAIVRHLLEARQRIDTLTAEAQRAINLLQERRTALISAAVTGQIDVRPLLKMEAA